MCKRHMCFWEYRGTLICLKVKDILYFMTKDRRLYVETEGKTYIITDTLSHIETQLRREPFVRVHHSYLVHMEKILMLDISEVVLYNGARLPMSEHKHKIVKIKYKKYLFSRENTMKIGKNTMKDS